MSVSVYSVSILVGVIIWSIVLSRPRMRAFFGRHRAWVAVTMLPLQPFLLVTLMAGLTSSRAEPEAEWVVLGCLAYVNGLIAFALVTGLQDVVRRDGVAEPFFRAPD